MTENRPSGDAVAVRKLELPRKAALDAVWGVVRRDDVELTTWTDSIGLVEMVLEAIEFDRVRDALIAFFAYEDDHVRSADPIEDNFAGKAYKVHVCDGCEQFWPCSVEELRRGIGRFLEVKS